MSEDHRTFSIGTLVWLLRLNARGSVQDRNLIEAILQDHISWKNPYGPKIYLSDARAELREQRASFSRKGGRHAKRSLWAEALACKLAAASKPEAWEAIPEPEESDDDQTIQAGGRNWIIYRDGDRLVAVDDRTGVEDSISRSTFLKRYLTRK
jgi:hypothetical protein